MAKHGNQFSDQAHCYEDLEGENSNAGETPMRGNQWADDVKYGEKESKGERDSVKEESVEASKAQRGKAGAKDEY